MMDGLEHQAKVFIFSLLGTVGSLEGYQCLANIKKSILLPGLTDISSTPGETENERWINMPKIAHSKNKQTLNVWMY